MNIFRLNDDPAIAAREQCDKHVVKMIVESGQMLSTTHRMHDGWLTKRPSKSGKTMVKYYVHPQEDMEDILYKAVHFRHPSTVWTGESKQNYMWHFRHFVELCHEYSYRYGKVHETEKLIPYLATPPKNITAWEETPFKLAMKSNPECMFPEDPVKSYRLFYQTKQDRFKMVWSKRQIPEWFRKSP
jgi:hypothetical protein